MDKVPHPKKEFLKVERMVSGSSIVVVSKEQVSADLAGESVVLHLKNGVYYGLDAVGTRIWALINTPWSWQTRRRRRFHLSLAIPSVIGD